MTEEPNPLETKRQEALERLRQRRSEPRRALTPPDQIQNEDLVMHPFVRLREARAEQAKDIAQGRVKAESPEDLQPQKDNPLRQARRAKRQAAKQLEQSKQNRPIDSLLNEDEKLLETFQQIRRAKRANRPDKKQPKPELTPPQPEKRRTQANDLPYPTDLIRDIHQQLLGEIEAALGDTPLDQLEQRRKDLKYRYNWLQSLLEEMREELDRIQEHIIHRLLDSPEPPTHS